MVISSVIAVVQHLKICSITRRMHFNGPSYLARIKARVKLRKIVGQFLSALENKFD